MSVCPAVLGLVFSNSAVVGGHYENILYFVCLPPPSQGY